MPAALKCYIYTVGSTGTYLKTTFKVCKNQSYKINRYDYKGTERKSIPG